MIRFEEAEELALANGGDIIINDVIFGIDVRFICTSELGWVIPVSDISKALGISKQTQSDILSKHKESFEPFVCVRTLPTGLTSSLIQHKCLTRDGITMYLMKLNPSQMRNQEVGKRISEFQIYVVKTFGEHLDYYRVPQWWARREASKIKYKTMTLAIKDHLITADIPESKHWLVYATEADMLNVVVFGKTAKEAGFNQREKASQSQLDILTKFEEMNEGFIRLGFPIGNRYEMICKIRDEMIRFSRIPTNQLPERIPDSPNKYIDY